MITPGLIDGCVLSLREAQKLSKTTTTRNKTPTGVPPSIAEGAVITVGAVALSDLLVLTHLVPSVPTVSRSVRLVVVEWSMRLGRWGLYQTAHIAGSRAPGGGRSKSRGRRYRRSSDR